MRVDRVFTRSIVGVPESCDLRDAAVMMHKYHVGALLVTGDEPHDTTVVGFVTDRDIVVQAVAMDIAPREITVGEVMTPVVATIGEAADLYEALEMMRSAGIRRLVVTDDENRISGFLSLDDVVDGLAAEFASLSGIIKTERAREVAQFEEMKAAA
ncbi:MAG: CBS domain-containing protein [Burkholderiales bacterium]|nr:CBS domain-containing protein [Burkholderiales bacterium]